METSNLPFRFESQDQCSILCLTPQLSEVDWNDVEQVGSEILQRLDRMSAPALLVDLSQLNYMGSSQVALVVRVWKVIKGRDGRMAVQVTHPLVKEVLKIAGLNNLWTLVDTREEAMKSLGVVAHRQRTSNPAVGLVLGVVGLMGAIAGLLVRVYSPNTLTPDVLAGILYGASGLALLGGLWSAVAGKGLNRGLGTLIAVAAAALITLQVLKQMNVL